MHSRNCRGDRSPPRPGFGRISVILWFFKKNLNRKSILCTFMFTGRIFFAWSCAVTTPASHLVLHISSQVRHVAGDQMHRLVFTVCLISSSSHCFKPSAQCTHSFWDWWRNRKSEQASFITHKLFIILRQISPLLVWTSRVGALSRVWHRDYSPSPTYLTRTWKRKPTAVGQPLWRLAVYSYCTRLFTYIMGLNLGSI